jgi:superfamily II helicase
MTDGLCDAPGERSFTDRLLGREMKPCGKRASMWGMDMNLKPVELCKPCWFYYTMMVEQHKMPQPKLKCHTCGKEIVMDVAEAARVLEMLHNPVREGGKKLRDRDPIFTCLDCKEPHPLGWATVSDHCRVLFNWSYSKPVQEVVTNA